MAVPTVQAVGIRNNGTGNVQVAYPVGYTKTANDIVIVYAECHNLTTLTIDQGFAEVDDSPQSGVGTKLYVFWKRISSTETAPTLTQGGTTNHICASMIVIRGCAEGGNPWNVTAGDTETADLSVEVPGDTTTVNDCLILAVSANEIDANTGIMDGSATNTDLGSVTTQLNINTSSGNGGGIAIVSGTKEAAGSFGTTTWNVTDSTTDARHSMALAPKTVALSPSNVGTKIAQAITIASITFLGSVSADELKHNIVISESANAGVPTTDVEINVSEPSAIYISESGLVVPNIELLATDSIAISEYAVIAPKYCVYVSDAAWIHIPYVNISVSEDTITVSETPTVLVPEVMVDVYDDTITVAESGLIQPDVLINIQEAMAIAEWCSAGLDAIFVEPTSEGIAIAESADVYSPEQFVSASESVVISEDRTVSVSSVSDVEVSGSDSLVIAETSEILVPYLSVSGIDNTICVADSADILITEKFISVEEKVVIADTADILVSEIVINVSDSILVAESAQTFIPESFISVEENVVLTDTANISVASEGDVNVSASDAIVISEYAVIAPKVCIYISDSANIEVVEGPPSISVSESIVASEYVVIDTGIITEYESAYIYEDVWIDVISFVSVSEDSINIAESPTILIPIKHISVSEETIVISEYSEILEPELVISVSDGTLISEDNAIQVLGEGEIPVYVEENIVISEKSSILEPELFVSVQDNVVISEYTSRSTEPTFISVSEAIIIYTDSAAHVAYPEVLVSVSDSIAISESSNIISAYVHGEVLRLQSRISDCIELVSRINRQIELVTLRANDIILKSNIRTGE